MKSSYQSKTTNQQGQSSIPSEDLARALFEKIMSNSEEIGKMKTEPFNIATVERTRSMYKENERLFLELEKAVRASK